MCPSMSLERWRKHLQKSLSRQPVSRPRSELGTTGTRGRIASHCILKVGCKIIKSFVENLVLGWYS